MRLTFPNTHTHTQTKKLHSATQGGRRKTWTSEDSLSDGSYSMSRKTSDQRMHTVGGGMLEILQSTDSVKSPRQCPTSPTVPEAEEMEGKLNDDIPTKMGVYDGSQPSELETFKKRMWLVHLKKPQIRFEVSTQILMGATHAVVQGFGFSMGLLPPSTFTTDQIETFLPSWQTVQTSENLLQHIRMQLWIYKKTLNLFFFFFECVFYK